MQIVVCIDDIWKMVNHVLGSWYMDGRYSFLLRHLSHVGVPDLEVDGMFGCCLDLIRSTGMVPSLVRHLVGPQNCILVMKPH